MKIIYSKFCLLKALITILFIGSLNESFGQNEASVDDIYTFNTETVRLYDNALVSDGTFLYDVRYDGGINGGGSIFKIKPDGSGYSVIYNFEDANSGLNPVGTLVLSGSTLYGMTNFGGSNNFGVIYKIEKDGTNFKKLFDFNNSNGAIPIYSMIISGTTLFGVSFNGGDNGRGLLFKIQTDGTSFQIIHSFNGPNGSGPTGALTLSGSVLYGTTVGGGDNNLGVVFAINSDGSGYRKLADLDYITGYSPFTTLIISGNSLYGTTSFGGSIGGGTFFKVKTNGTGLTVLHDFGSLPGINPIGKPLLIGNRLFGMTGNGGYADGLIYSIDTVGTDYKILHYFTKIDGRNPQGSLTLIGDKLYAHISGGTNDYGVIFNINQDGSSFTKLKDFEATNKGYEPSGGLALTKSSGFGVTSKGGVYNKGVIYRINNKGLNYQVLHDFDGINGEIPESTMLLLGNTLYGTTLLGGSSGQGTLFKMDTTGANFEVLVNFNGDNGSAPIGSLIDGGSTTLYGMARGGTFLNKGTVFKFDKSTKILTTLYDFSTTDVTTPYGGIVLTNSKLVGMCLGDIGQGIVFELNLDGTGFKKLVDKSATEAGRYPNSLTVSGSTIYGTMKQGGTSDSGTLFRVKTDGSGFQKLIDFTFNLGEGSTGVYPTGEIIVVGDSIIYGMTELGGPNNSGTLYSISTDGSNFTIVYSFNEFSSSSGGRIQSSASPVVISGSLAFKNEFIYAPVALSSGEQKTGSIIKYRVDGSEFITGTEKNKSDQQFVYPNPTHHLIRLSNQLKNSNAYVINSFGIKVQTRINDDSIDVSNLPPGVYFLVSGAKRYRFIKL